MMSVFMQRMTLVISSYIRDVSPNRPGSLFLSKTLNQNNIEVFTVKNKRRKKNTLGIEMGNL